MSHDADPESDDSLSGDPWYDHKSKLMESILGPEHDMVMHSIIPYDVGGGLDLYYYPGGLPGTAIATKELSRSPEEGSTNDAFRTYELVMFTRHVIDIDQALDETTPFGQAHTKINAVLNLVARFSEQATLNPGETCEFPADFEDVGGKCFVFEALPVPSEQEDASEGFGLLAVIEVFRTELEFALEEGGEVLLERLRLSGHFPYSDLDRDPVA